LKVLFAMEAHPGYSIFSIVVYLVMVHLFRVFCNCQQTIFTIAFICFQVKFIEAQAPTWAFAFGGSAGDHGRAIALDDDGNIFVAGDFTGEVDFELGPASVSLISAGETDVFVAKYDSAFNLIWVKQIGGSGSDDAAHMILDSQGNIYLTGQIIPLYVLCK